MQLIAAEVIQTKKTSFETAQHTTITLRMLLFWFNKTRQDSEDLDFNKPSPTNCLVKNNYILAKNGNKGMPTIGLLSRILDITDFVVIGTYIFEDNEGNWRNFWGFFIIGVQYDVMINAIDKQSFEEITVLSNLSQNNLSIANIDIFDWFEYNEWS